MFDAKWVGAGVAVDQGRLDEGLRAHMLSVYNHMGAGLALSAVVAAAVGWTDLKGLFFAIGPRGAASPTILGLVARFAPLVMLLAAMFMKVHTWSPGATRSFFWTFAGLKGIALGASFAAYPTVDIVRAALATAVVFGGVSLFGYTTKRNLSGLGLVCLMALLGLMVVSLLGLFFGFALSATLVSFVVVLLFAGLTAWETQRIKSEYMESAGQGMETAAVWSALSLYINVVAIFQSLLSLMGVGGGNDD